jgi:SAM-dependent methyltransferase
MAARGTHDEVLRLLRQDPSIRTVLDIPSGQGAFAARLRKLGYVVHAADVVPPDHGEEGWTPANMNERLPFADASLDAVVCIDGIEHIERQYDFAVECARVVRPGGVVIWSTPNISSLRSRWRWLWTGFHHGRKAPLDENNVNPLHHINMIEFPKLRYMLHRSGLCIDAIATNRTKAVAWVYAPLAPFSWLLTKLVFASEIRSPSQAAIGKNVLRQMHAPSLLFGDAIIVRAVRLAAPSR